MQRVCFLLKVKQDKIEEYRGRQQEVWPEMLDALRDTGGDRYSRCLAGDGLLVAYVGTPDLQAARDGMANREVNERWQNEMAPFFESLDGRHADESMIPL